ncbi:MAG: DPP IV N-terminal domain-containing protein, partial [Bacteroidota bacterium]
MKHIHLLTFILLFPFLPCLAQEIDIKWASEGHSYYCIENNEIIRYDLPGKNRTVIASEKRLTPKGMTVPIHINNYTISSDEQKVLIFTNTAVVWRLDSKGDYWVLDIVKDSLQRLGKPFPWSSMMFAKFSPDSKRVAYVSRKNLYVEDLSTGRIDTLTRNGTKNLINGTFDYVYEEAFACRDGFRWSPDGKSIAYWQIDATKVRKYNLINYTDSVYSQCVQREYPKVGEDPPSARIGVVNLNNGLTTWMNIPGDPFQNYIVRMEYIPGAEKLLIQQLNRKQNIGKLLVADIYSGNTSQIFEEKDDAWIEIFQPEDTYNIDFTNTFQFSPETNSILWFSEKDGWRHLYLISLDGKHETLMTKGDFDILGLKFANINKGILYFMASPDNATQKYLYRLNLIEDTFPALKTPKEMAGMNNYFFSADGLYAYHTFSNHLTRKAGEFIEIEGHKPVDQKESILARFDSLQVKKNMEYFRIT